MSELLRPKQRVRQVDEQSHGDEKADGVIDRHGVHSLQPLAGHDVGRADREKQDGDDDEQQVEH
jgi:hypothetical protein